MSGIAALIVNYNGGKALLDTLASLPGAGVPIKSVVLVDNASTDGSAARAAGRFPGITLLETRDDYSFAAANNLGLNYLSGNRPPKAVLFLNNDVILKPGSVKRLFEALLRDDTLGAVSPIIYDTRGRLWYAGGKVDWREAGGRLYGQGMTDRPVYHRPARVDFATLCVLLVRWNALVAVGPLDETYHFYDEDLELCLRLGKAGFGIGYMPVAEAVHLVGHSTAERGPEFIYHNMARNRLMTMRRYGLPGRWMIFVPYFGAMMAYKAVKFTLRGQPKTAAAIFSGIMRGLRDRPVPHGAISGEKH